MSYIIIIIIIIFKTSSTGLKSEKSNCLLINFPTQQVPVQRKTEKTQRMEATNDWLHI